MAADKQSSASSGPSDVLDVRGHFCPLPVLKTQKALAGLPTGATLKVLASDPAARIDMAHFCATTGHRLLSSQATDNHLTFIICKT